MKRTLIAFGLTAASAALIHTALAQPPGGGRGFGPGGPGGQGGPGARGFGPIGPGGRGFNLPIITALDADGDGEISAKEIDNAATALRSLDKNKDGKVTRDEMLPAFREGGPGGFGGPGGPGGPGGGPDPAELVNRMMAFDKNGDGKLAKSELPERMQNLLDRADTNKDGFVDRDELTKQAQQQSGRGRGGFGPGREGRGFGEGRGPGGPGEGGEGRGPGGRRGPGRDDQSRS